MSANQAVSVKVDHTIRLPNEVLCWIMSHIPSMPHRFKLAAMSNKFRRCVMSELSKPMPLNINFCSRTLNGHKVPIDRWPQAVQVLAPKTCFTQIALDGCYQFYDWCECGCYQKVDQLLYSLTVTECLHQVRVFKLVGFPYFMCNSSILPKVLTLCPKLSILQLDFVYKNIHKNLFESLQPKMLQSLDLSFPHSESPNFVNLLSNSGAVLLGLREMRLCYDYGTTVQHLDALFGTVLPQLRLLQSCTIDCGIKSYQAVVNGLLPLFNNCRRQQPTFVKIVFSLTRNLGLFGCVAVNLFTQLQQHPDMQIDFDDEKMRLKLESVTLVTAVSQVPHFNCLQCRRVYTVVVEELALQAGERRSLHLANYRLDRCKVNRIVMDLYAKRELHQGDYYLPQSAVINEAGDLVVISFEDEDGDQFYITIDCGHCLSGSCVGCVHI